MRPRTEIEVKLTLIRHGATASNLEHRYLGKTDEPLCETGEQELLFNKRNHDYPSVSYLFSGPMYRCRQTAALLFPGQSFQIVPSWTEMDFGLFEGKNYMELNDQPDYQAWIDSGGRLPFPEGESREEFIHRSIQGFRQMMVYLQAAAKSSRVSQDQICVQAAAVVHGGTIMALYSMLSGGEYFDCQVPCGKGLDCHFICSDGKIQLLELKKL